MEALICIKNFALLIVGTFILTMLMFLVCQFDKTVTPDSWFFNLTFWAWNFYIVFKTIVECGKIK